MIKILSVDYFIDIPFFPGYKINPMKRIILGKKGTLLNSETGYYDFYVNRKTKHASFNKVLYAMSNEIDIDQIPKFTNIEINNGEFVLKSCSTCGNEAVSKNAFLRRKKSKETIISQYLQLEEFSKEVIKAHQTGDFNWIYKEIESKREKIIQYFKGISHRRIEYVEYMVDQAIDSLRNAFASGEYFIRDIENWLKQFLRQEYKRTKNIVMVNFNDDTLIYQT